MSADLSQLSARLNPDQRRAVEQIEGPVLVIAGPGTGKTHVLSLRIANILQQTDAHPSNILALTYTDAAAAQMRRRIAHLIGPAGYSVRVTTFHSFCSEVIQSNPSYFPQLYGAQPLSTLERYQLIESIITTHQLEHLKPLNTPLYYTKGILDAISTLKREGVSVLELEQLNQSEVQRYEEQLAKKETKTLRSAYQTVTGRQRELLAAYTAYQQQLHATNRFDFEDMIMLVADSFHQHPDLLVQYQEELQYIHVDEYQDTNTAQNQVLDALSSFWGEQANIFAVGDPHQSIYRFQGASVENTFSFLTRYPRAETVVLTTGYRCPQSIYNAAHALISHNTLTHQDTLTTSQTPALLQALNTKLVSATSASPDIAVSEYETTVLENYATALAIQKKIQEGVSPSQIAVLVRKHDHARELLDILGQLDIPYITKTRKSVLEEQLLVNILLYLRAIVSFQEFEDSYELFSVLELPWLEIPRVALYTLAGAARRQHTTLLAVLDAGYSSLSDEEKTKISLEDWDAILQAIQDMQQYASIAVAHKPHHLLAKLYHDQSILEWARAQDNSLVLLEQLRSLHSFAVQLARAPGATVQTILEAVATYQHHGIALTSQPIVSDKNAVTISTAHNAKGGEWEHVYIMHCSDRVWGNTKSSTSIKLPSSILSYTDISKKEKNEDERRLFYVALTRAKESITISYARQEVTLEKTKELVPSVFLAEIDSLLEHTQQATPAAEELVQLAVASQLAVPKLSYTSTQEKEYFQQKVNHFTLSVSALNTYLRDPEQFAYRYLVRSPSEPSVYLSFGSAVHTALEAYNTSVLNHEEETSSLEVLLNSFQTALERDYPGDDFARRLQHGQEALTSFAKTLSKRPATPLAIERVFGGSARPVHLDDIPLVGKIDRIDVIDEKNKLVRITDYKTGRSFSDNDIHTATKSSVSGFSARELALDPAIRSPHKRQMLFYALLAQLDPHFGYRVQRGEFLFVEPEKSGNHTVRTVEIVQKEVDMLADLIKDVMKELRGLRFLEETPHLHPSNK
ncbi:MAG: ATP-dependent helicase [Pseudomonadales bacterium]|nr:ATP-dependent helicase [Pseudomonadales bacterium]